MDKCFSNSLQSAKKGLLFKILLHLIQFVTIAIIIPLDKYLFKNQPEVLSFFIAALITVLISLFAKLNHYFCELSNPNSFMAIAAHLNHIVSEEPQSERLSDSGAQVNLNLESQNIYNIQTNSSIEEVTPFVRASVEPALSRMIQSLALSRDPLNRCTISIVSYVSIGLFIFGIAFLAKKPMSLG